MPESEKREFRFHKYLPRGVFTQKSAVSRPEFEKIALRGGRYILPGGRGKIWKKADIKKILEEDFPKNEFKSIIPKKMFEKKMEDLAVKKYKARTGEEKKEIEQKIRFYRKKFLRGF